MHGQDFGERQGLCKTQVDLMRAGPKLSEMSHRRPSAMCRASPGCVAKASACSRARNRV